MYQLQNIDYLYRISTMTGSSKLVTVQADRDSHDLNDKHLLFFHKKSFFCFLGFLLFAHPCESKIIKTAA